MGKLAFLGIGLVFGVIIGIVLTKLFTHQPPRPIYQTIEHDIEFKGITYLSGPVMICNDGGCWSLEKCPQAR
jgi:hypothetical protein